jgi:hypothetical protein
MPSLELDYEEFVFKVNGNFAKIDAQMNASDLSTYLKESTKKNGVSLRVKGRAAIKRIAQLIQS